MNPFSIQGKRTLITGGTAGIGLAVARHFAAAGARVVISGRRSEGSQIAADIGATFVEMDVSDPESVARGTVRAGDQLGGHIDVLILNAGINTPSATIQTASLDDFRATFDVNVFGVVSGLKEALAYLLATASVIITSSPAANTYTAGMGAYASSKAAVNALTRLWALELGPLGIRVNAVLPGIVDTAMSIDPDGGHQELDMIQTLTSNNVIRAPEAFGPIFQFLASEASAPCTGAILESDDGISAGLSQALLSKAFNLPSENGSSN